MPRGRFGELDDCAPFSPAAERMKISRVRRTACGCPMTWPLRNRSPSAIRSRRAAVAHGLSSTPIRYSRAASSSRSTGSPRSSAIRPIAITSELPMPCEESASALAAAAVPASSNSGPPVAAW